MALCYVFQDIMNREKEDELPMMQVGFIDSICMPIYEVGGVPVYYRNRLKLEHFFYRPTGIRGTVTKANAPG